MALNYDQALSEIAKAGQIYNEAKARGDMNAANAAHSYAQNIRNIAGIEGDGQTRTGLEGTTHDPVQKLAEVRMQQPTPQPKMVRETPYFVEQQFDPRQYKLPDLKEPVATLPGHVVTPALRQSTLQEWLQKVGVMQQDRQFAYDMSNDAYNRREAEKQYNNALALDFSKRYGIPINPMESLQNLFAQVKGIKPLDVQQFEYGKERDAIRDNQWQQEFGANEAYRNANLGLDKQRLGMQWQGMLQDLEQSGFNKLMDTWKMTGIAPEGLEAYGIQAGTPVYDPSVQKQQQIKEEEFKNEVSSMIQDVREGNHTVRSAYEQIAIDEALGFYTPQQADVLKQTLRDYTKTLPQGPPMPGTPEWDKELQSQGFINKQEGGGYSNYWKTEKNASKSQNYSDTKMLLEQAAKQSGVPQSWVPPLLELVGRESSWNPKADNPKSTAFGLFQFLDSTHKNYSNKLPQYSDRNNSFHQAMLGIQYVKDRYKTPEQALSFWDKNNWY